MAIKPDDNEKKDSRSELLLNDLLVLENYISDLWSFSPLPICFVSPIQVILEANPAFEEISGYTMEEIIGESTNMFFIDADLQKLAEQTSKKGFVRGEKIILTTKTDEKILVQAFTKERVGEKGESRGYFLGLFDLSEIKQTETELKKTQTALLNILEDTENEREKAEEEKRKTEAIIFNFTDGLLVFDKKNKLTSINLQAEKFLNVKRKKLIGKSISELSKISETAILTKKIKPGLKIFRQELEIDKELILEVSTVLLETETQKSGFLIVLHDVTREKRIERLKTEFVSISAHQLRTPLSAIKWTLKMLLERDLGDINSEQEEFLQRTYSSNERMISLVNSLLDVSRIEEGRFVYKPVLSNLLDVAALCVKNNKDNAKRRKINLRLVSPKKKLPDVLIDKEKMGLAIQNLIDNALKYTLAGGSVVVSLKKIDNQIQFKIKDTGIGILKSQHERVFQKFFRSEKAIRLETEGSGLGLFIAKNVVEAHKGKIRFESSVSKGTTFWFTLPIKN